MTQRLVGFSSLLVIALAAPAPAQLIQIRTFPLAQGDQFQIFPSNNLGMGGVSIALPDSLLDPFSNPATAGRLAGARFFSAPTVYGLSHDAGGGRTLPLGTLVTSGAWYGGLSMALQEVDASRTPTFSGLVPLPATADPLPPLPGGQTVDVGPRPQSYANRYALALVGKRLAHRLSLGGSVRWARLDALDGVDLLYAGSARVAQFGHDVDVRVGALKEWAAGQSLEALVLHDHFGMTDDVTYIDRVWDPGTQRVLQRLRAERSVDRTYTWGLHVQYARPISLTGWRVGWVATVNRMSHPSLPDYQLAGVQTILRDPGRSTAVNLGVGFSRSRGPATFGLDVLYEPIWSHTWADARAPIRTTPGDTLPAGLPATDNRFRFSNAILRMGVSRDLELRGLGRAAGFELGLMIHSIRYRLRQTDNVQGLVRTLDERWVEWTPTWGLSLRFPELEIRYRARATHGTGRPGAQPLLLAPAATVLAAGILVVPSGSQNLVGVSTVTHQLSVSLPLP